MNQKTAKSALIFLERVRGEPIDLFLRELEANESLSPSEINELQWQKFIYLLRHAYQNSPYYRERFNEVGLHPSDIKTRADVANIPVLTKEDFQENAHRIRISDPTRRMTLAKTSGSTGVPLRFYKDRTSSGYAMAAMYRGHRWHGLDIGAKEAMLWGVPVNFRERQAARIKDLVLNRFREKEYNFRDDVLKDFHNKLERMRPEYLAGYSSMVYEFACFLRENGYDGRQLRLKMVKCTSETVHDMCRKVAKEVFGCNVVSEYGAAETGVIAFECPEGNHHLMTDCVYAEFMTENGKPNWRTGTRILVTDLHNYAVPVIKYDIGDSVVPSDRMCACGRPFPIIEQVLGRLGSVVLTPHGQRFHSIIFYYIMKGLASKKGGVRCFKVYQENVDRLRIQLVADRNFSDSSLKFLNRELTKYFGPAMRIDFEFCNSIPREESGKLRDFVQEIDLSCLKEHSTVCVP